MEIRVNVYGNTELAEELWEENEDDLIASIERLHHGPVDESLTQLIKYSFTIGVFRAVSEMEKSLSYR